MREEILRMENVTKKIQDELFLENINLHIFKGQIMGLLASEAKGKEQLIELLCQNLPIDYGRIYYNNELVNNYEHSDMSMNKVSLIEMESKLIQDLTVADNIFVLRKGFKKYIINKKLLGIQVDKLFNEMQIEVDANKTIRQLKPLERCVVELVKARLSGSNLIILNDLSNFLSSVELAKFHEIIKKYCSNGSSFLYVANHHQEVFKICHETALFSQGRIIKIFDSKEMIDENIAPFIISFEMSEEKMKNSQREAILEFQNISTNNLRDMSFSIRKGECVVLLDLNNTALNDIRDIMTQELKPEKGKVIFNGESYMVNRSKNFLDYRIAIIEDNPVKTMIFHDMDYLENLTFLIDKKLKKSMLRKYLLKSIVKEYEPLVGGVIHERDITVLSRQSLYELIYYRIHLFRPKLVFCIQPFAWGDMFIRRKVLDLLQILKNSGVTVIISAVSLSDTLDIADRIMLLQNGQFLKEYSEDEFHLLKEQK